MRFIIITFFCITCTFDVQAQVFDITNFGAVGNGSTINTQAIQAAVDSCSQSGGGIVEVPAGNFVTGTIFLKSNVTFNIASGGTITGSDNLSNYPDVHPQKRTYTDNYPQKSVFYAEGQHNIAVTGEGTFNGNGQSVNFLLNMNSRPLGFRFISCTNVRYDGLHLKNSGFWMMHNFDVDTLTIKNLNIINQSYGNNDGVDIDGCRHVLVDSIFADCNDDPMVIKTTSLIGANDIEIKNCTVATYSRAIKIGSETNGAISNVYIHDCTVQLSTNGPLSNNAASCGINLSIVDGGSMENVRVENINMNGIKTPFFIRLGNRARKYNDTAATPGVGYVHGVSIENITATATSNISSSVTGIVGHPAQSVLLKNIDVTFPGGWPAVSNGFTVPENDPGKPDADMFGDTLPAAGLFIRHVDSIRLDHVCFHPLQPDGRPTFFLDDVTNFDSTGVCLETNIGEMSSTHTLHLFPNPVHDFLNIETLPTEQPEELIIYNGIGQILIRQKLATSTSALQMDVRNLNAGLYFLTLKGNGLQTRQIFIKK